MSPAALHRSASAGAAAARSAQRRHRVILIREQDAQHSGSGCCGRLGGRHTELGAAADFSHSRARMEQVGAIYRALATAAPDIELTVADPRNLVWLYPTIWRAARARARGHGIGATLHTIARAGSPVAVVFDGEVLFAGRLPACDAVVEAVLARRDAADPGRAQP